MENYNESQQNENQPIESSNEDEKSINIQRILIFLGFTFLITYAYEFLVVHPILKAETPNQVLATLSMGAAMFIPALCALLTRLMTGEGLKNSYMWPRFKGNMKYYLAIWFGIPALVLLGAVLFFIVFPDKFDPNMTAQMKILKDAMAALPQNQQVPMEQLKLIILIQSIVGVLLAPVINFLPCFGEEWGWRGYLLPKMEKVMPLIPMLLVNGVIWGLWHLPLTMIGHNYGTGYFGEPFTGILAMCVFCIVFGIIFSYVTVRTKSCIPAILGHGSLNGLAALGVLFSKDTTANTVFLGPTPVGVIGGAGFIVCAILIVAFWNKSKVTMSES